MARPNDTRDTTLLTRSNESCGISRRFEGVPCCESKCEADCGGVAGAGGSPGDWFAGETLFASMLLRHVRCTVTGVGEPSASVELPSSVTPESLPCGALGLPIRFSSFLAAAARARLRRLG